METDIFLQELTVDGGRVANDTDRELQRKVFEVTRKGDLEKFRSLLILKCDVNCVSNSGKTLLQVAGELKDVSVRNEMIIALLNSGADLDLALLHAIRESNIKTVEILLQFHEAAPQPSPCAVGCLKRQGYVTPLILAACLQNFQIVTRLLERGYNIRDPKFSQLSFGSEEMVGEKLGPAVYRLNGFRALSSPVYIAASFLQDVQSGSDPIHRACVLNKELRGMAEQEYEFKKEYLELSDGCKEFAVALLNECRSMEEIKCVMEKENEDGKLGLNILEFAISTRNEKFVSHPYSQLVLNSEVYKSVPFLEKSTWKQALLILLATVLFPLFFLVWVACDSCFPGHEVARMLHSPCVKFLIHCGSYQTFLFLLAFTSFHSQSGFLEYSIIDWIVLSFIIGQLVDVIKDIYRKGMARFCSNYWNYLATASVTSFGLHYVIWWAGRAALIDKVDSMKWETHATYHGYTTILVSYCFFAVGILLAFALNLSFIQANSSAGPLLHAFIQMLIDVANFFSYFVFVFLAFAVSFTKLYLQYDKAKQHFLSMSGAGTINETDPLHLERFGSSMATIFWSLFGEIDEGSFQIDSSGYGAIWKTGMVLFGAFNIVAVLVALNMLIAILSESYTRITENLDTEWKFTRTKLWLSWIHKKGVLPPPFNVLYVLLPVVWAVKRLVTACSPSLLLLLENERKRRLSWKVERTGEKERREVIRHLVLRYLAKQSCHSETGTESSESAEEIAEPLTDNTVGTSQSNKIATTETTL